MANLVLFSTAFSQLTCNGKLPKLDLRVVHLVVVEKVDEGDGLAPVRGPLVQAPRGVLLGGAADQVTLEELDLEDIV